jgi:hypothetical protein
MEILLAIAIIGLIFSLVLNSRSKKAFEKIMKEQGFDTGIRNAIYRYGLPNTSERTLVNVYANNEKLVIAQEDLKYEIEFPKLTAVEFVDKVEQLEKNKSALARGIAGGLVLGPLGAIAGAASGIGKKKEKGSFVVINYKSDGDIKAIILQITRGIFKAGKFAKEMRNRIIKLNTENGTVKL